MTEGASVLFVDDEANVLNAVKRLFTGEPFQITTTSDPAEALAIIDREKIKVVLCDHLMVTMTGSEFLKKVKKKNPDIVRILFTGYEDIEAVEEAINVIEVYAIINKPWDGAELKAMIWQAIRYYELVSLSRKLLEQQREIHMTVQSALAESVDSMKAALDTLSKRVNSDNANEDQANSVNALRENVERIEALRGGLLELSRLETDESRIGISRNKIK